MGAGWWGKLYEENGRGILSDKSGEPYLKTDDWNTYEIVAVGSKIRTALSACCPPPKLPAEPSRRSAMQVLAHLQTAFPDVDCPIATFQHAMRTFFM